MCFSEDDKQRKIERLMKATEEAEVVERKIKVTEGIQPAKNAFNLMCFKSFGYTSTELSAGFDDKWDTSKKLAKEAKAGFWEHPDRGAPQTIGSRRCNHKVLHKGNGEEGNPGAFQGACSAIKSLLTLPEAWKCHISK